MIPIADGIAKTFGENCEVAIHDLTHPIHSIYHIVNGSLTQRKKGDSLGSMFKELIQLATSHEDCLINYYDCENGHEFRCSKMLIRDENGSIIGCFCINIAMDDFLKLKRFTDMFCTTKSIEDYHRSKPNDAENISDISELVTTLIDNTFAEFISGKSKLTKADKVEMVKFLNDKGIFTVKGTVEKVAGMLDVSKFTVYNYIDQANDGHGETQDHEHGAIGADAS